jgi:hypothetical protein
MPSRNREDRSPAEHELLAALADGSLGEQDRDDLEARVADSPELQAMLEEQQRALTLVRSAVADVEAPPRLRARVEARRKPAERRRFLPIAGIAVAAACALLAAFAVWPSGGGGPSVAQAAELGTKPPTGPPPQTSPRDPKLLKAEQDGVAFPAWDTKFGWQAAGERQDKLHGRETTTVYYVKNGKALAYTIVGGDALKWPKGGRETHREGTKLKVIHRDGRTIVTWQRDGRTCVLSGVDVPEPTMVKLAAWHGKGSVPF